MPKCSSQKRLFRYLVGGLHAADRRLRRHLPDHDGGAHPRHHHHVSRRRHGRDPDRYHKRRLRRAGHALKAHDRAGERVRHAFHQGAAAQKRRLDGPRDQGSRAARRRHRRRDPARPARDRSEGRRAAQGGRRARHRRGVF